MDEKELNSMCHNTLVRTNEKLTNIKSSVKYNILYDLEYLKQYFLDGGENKDTKYNAMCRVIKLIDCVNNQMEEMDIPINWFDTYITEWKENKK